MGQSFSLGRIGGIRIGVNWSVVLIVALLAYGLAAGQFPAEVPRRPEAEYVIAAIVTAVAYMASLLAPRQPRRRGDGDQHRPPHPRRARGGTSGRPGRPGAADSQCRRHPGTRSGQLGRDQTRHRP
jgi:hypothetical protein